MSHLHSLVSLQVIRLFIMAFAFVGSNAFAQLTITQNGSFSNVDDPANLTLTFNQFDSSLGTLTSVEFDLTDVVVTGTPSVTSTSNGNRNFTIALTGEYAMTDINGNTVTISLTTSNQTSPKLMNGDSWTGASESSAAVSGSITFSGASNLAPYIGTGTTGTTVTLTSANSVTVSTPFSNTTSQISSGSGNYEIIYTYTPVPEPSETAAYMIAFGLCLMVGRNYLKRRSLAQL